MIKPVLDEGDFCKITREAISAKRHTDFVEDAIKEYEDINSHFCWV